VKLSQNYQTAECSYHVTLECDDDPESIEKTTKRAEKYVTAKLQAKLKDNAAFLQKLGN
jgi:hypothetical protein